jgi:hypothetical protein
LRVTDRERAPSLSLERLGPYLGQALGISFDELLRAFRPAIESDLPRILSLRRDVIGNSLWWDDEAFVRWRYFDSRFSPPFPFWVLTLGDELVGAVGLEPVTLVVDGVAHAAHRTLDIMVRPDFEGRGVGGFMNLVLLKHFPLTTVTGSNERSHKLISRTWQRVVELHAWKILLRSHGFLQQKVGPLLAGPLAPAADVVLRVDQLRRHRTRTRGVEIRELDAFDSQVDRLSAACEGTHRVIVRRHTDYLNWRFTRNPRCRYRLLGAFSQSRLVAYVVTRFNRRRPNPNDQSEIVDWLEDPAVPGTVLGDLFATAVGRLRQDGASMVACLCSPSAAPAAFAMNGLIERPDETLPFFLRATSPELHARLEVAADWFLTAGDFDVE